jgi:hypothetical protein
MSEYGEFLVQDNSFTINLPKPISYIQRVGMKIIPFMLFMLFIINHYIDKLNNGEEYVWLMLLIYIAIIVVYSKKIFEAETDYIYEAKFDKDTNNYRIKYHKYNTEHIKEGRLDDLDITFSKNKQGIHNCSLTFVDINDENTEIEQYNIKAWSKGNMIDLEEFIYGEGKLVTKAEQV